MLTEPPTTALIALITHLRALGVCRQTQLPGFSFHHHNHLTVVVLPSTLGQTLSPAADPRRPVLQSLSMLKEKL